MLYPHKSHELYLNGNGWFVKTVDDMKRVFEEVREDPSSLSQMRANSLKIAMEMLDYRLLAARLYM